MVVERKANKISVLAFIHRREVVTWFDLTEEFGYTYWGAIKRLKTLLKEDEDAKLPQLIEFAYRAGYLKKPSFQEFMVFCINCAYTRLKEEYERSKGRR